MRRILLFVVLTAVFLTGWGGHGAAFATVDVTPPDLLTVSRTSPDVVGPGDTVAFDWTVSDDSSIGYVEFWAYGPHDKIKRIITRTAKSRDGLISTGTSSMNIDSTTWPPGIWHIEFVMLGDSVGNGSDTRYDSPPAAVDLTPLAFEVLNAFQAAPLPSITGDARAGNTLTAAPGAWTPTPSTMAYQWIRNGVPIAGADGAGYEVQQADAGANLVLSVTASLEGYKSMKRLSSAVQVATSALESTPAPTIGGTPTVGDTLTAESATWEPAPVTLQYQWHRDGAPISGERQSTYALRASDVGRVITVVATGTRSGYTSTSKSSVGTTISAGTLQPADPTINGWPTVGNILWLDLGQWHPVDLEFEYQWYRDGSAIDGATTNAHELTVADAGHTISVEVTGTKPGYTPAARTSGSLPIAELSLISTPAPVLSGTAAVGQTLTASTAAWEPSPVQLDYQWYRGSSPIVGAVGSSYTVTAADGGSAISVRATGIKSGFTSVTVESAAKSVPASKLTATPTPTITGSSAVGATLTAVTGTWSPAPIALAYQWYRSGAAIPGATASTYKLAPADASRSVTVTVTGSKTGYTSAAKTSAAKLVAKQLSATPTPTISGTGAVGKTLTAIAGAWSPSLVTLKYQWYRNDAAISGATASSYKPVTADAGKAITVRVTGSKSGYTTVSKTSVAKMVGMLLTATPVPKISGTGAVGATLTGMAGSWQPGPVTLKYQWYRNGAAIAAATASTYKLVSADAGKSITVKVTGSRTGYSSVAKTSATKTIAKQLTATPVPSISGTGAVGKTLTAIAGTWRPDPGTLKYQWYRNGAAISGATAKSYKLASADAGRSVTVKVTGSRSGYSTIAKTSAAKGIAVPPPANPGSAMNCDDFATQPASQAWFDKYFSYYGDVAGLDADDDGVPCENLPVA
jgi:hypothetical protein